MPFAVSWMKTKVRCFWGYFPAYDWVVFSWLFGNMDELPFHFPQLCLDIKQLAIELGDPELPHQIGARHHASWLMRDGREMRGSLSRPLRPISASGGQSVLRIQALCSQVRSSARTARRQHLQKCHDRPCTKYLPGHQRKQDG